MSNIIISENYNPNRKVQYIWQIKSEHNDMAKIKRLFEKHDKGIVGCKSFDAWQWDEEKKLFTSEGFSGCYPSPVDHLSLKDEYYLMKQENYDEFFDKFLHQWWQFRNIVRFTKKWVGVFFDNPCKGVIKSDGSHAKYGVGMFSEKDFVEPFVEENNYLIA